MDIDIGGILMSDTLILSMIKQFVSIFSQDYL